MTKSQQTKADLKLLKSLGVETKNLILRANRTYEYKGSSTWAYSLDQFNIIEARTAYFHNTKPVRRWNRQMRRKWFGKNFIDYGCELVSKKLFNGEVISLNDKINLKREYQEIHYGKSIRLTRFRDNYISYGRSKYYAWYANYQDIYLGGRLVGILITRNMPPLDFINATGETWQVCLPDNLIEGCDRVMESEDEGYSICQFSSLDGFYKFIKTPEILQYLKQNQ